MSRRPRKRSLSSGASKARRAGQDRLIVEPLPLPPLLYTHQRQFERVPDDGALLLYYTASAARDQVIFDPENDRRLRDLHTDPYSFSSDQSLPLLIALRSRAYFELRLHPNQAAALREASELGTLSERDNVLVFVYRRDSARRSPVKNRRQTPFYNSVNGIESGGNNQSATVHLFRKHSYEPFSDARVVWQQHGNKRATVGIVAIALR